MAFVTMVKHEGKPVMVIQFDDTAEVDELREETGRMSKGASGDIFRYLKRVYHPKDYNGPSSDD